MLLASPLVTVSMHLHQVVIPQKCHLLPSIQIFTPAAASAWSTLLAPLLGKLLSAPKQPLLRALGLRVRSHVPTIFPHPLVYTDGTHLSSMSHRCF